jgi:hypothetical protein
MDRPNPPDIRLLVRAHLTSSTPTKSNLHFDCSFKTDISDPITFHVPHLMSVFKSSGRFSKESVKHGDPFRRFVTSLDLLWWRVSPTPDPQAGGSPLVGCLRLLIHNIRSYPPQLDVISIRNPRTRNALVRRDSPNLEGHAIAQPV